MISVSCDPKCFTDYSGLWRAQLWVHFNRICVSFYGFFPPWVTAVTCALFHFSTLWCHLKIHYLPSIKFCSALCLHFFIWISKLLKCILWEFQAFDWWTSSFHNNKVKTNCATKLPIQNPMNCCHLFFLLFFWQSVHKDSKRAKNFRLVNFEKWEYSKEN